MDPNQPARRARGRARGYSGPPLSGPPPSSSNAPRPQLSGPRNVGPRHPPVRQQMPQPSQGVEEVRREIESLRTTGLPAQVGRGTIRGRHQLDEPFFRLPRPQSSKGNNGKQGTLGQPLMLTSNYFPITTYTNWSLYQYRVDFNPPQDRSNTQRGLLGVHKDTLGPYLFDGTMMFSSQKFQKDPLELTSKRAFDGEMVAITIQFVKVLEKNDHKFIQVFNILLRSCLRRLNLQLVGRNYYDESAKIQIPQHRLELWPGYETSIDMFDNGLLLRAEISTKVMRQDTALNFFQECFANGRDKEMSLNNFKSGIIGAIVLTSYNNQTYRIDDVVCDQGINSSFKRKDGTSMTYKDYYREKWNLEIRGGNQPLLVSKKKKNFGNTEEPVYLIPEFCSMTGLTDKMRTNFNLMKDLAVHTRVMPKLRIQRYTNFIRRVLEQAESLQILKDWNLTPERRLVEVQSRVLPCETLSSNLKTYSSGQTADWTVHMRSNKMYTCVVVNSFVVLSPQRCLNDVNAFLRSINKAAEGMGFRLPNAQIETLADTKPQNYVTKLEQVIMQKNPTFILVVVESNRSDLYAVIKRKLCVDRAVPSQVVVLRNVQKNNLSVCTKIAVQVNCKLGGAPWRVNIPAKGMMIVGFDVCHDKQRDKNSYGGFVSTMDDTHTNYFSSVQPHPKGQDISSFFGNCMIQALHKYKMKNKVFPTSIVIYRDGVGEGQLSHVHSTEVSAVKKCCKSILGDNFGMAYIVVTKRINTRFFVQQSNGDASNPPPGTVVDSVVTNPTMYDFYLVSQHVTQGTVTPTHYTVLEDDLKNWSVDRMQKLTYKLTHMYYNWTGTVRVPAPCQLAHKLAYLTATTLQTSPNEGLDELLYYL